MMEEPLKVDAYVTNNNEWVNGYLSSEDTHCFVMCSCGEEFSISGFMKSCPNCGRKYWTEFRAYRMETLDQFRESIKEGIMNED